MIGNDGRQGVGRGVSRAVTGNRPARLALLAGTGGALVAASMSVGVANADLPTQWNLRVVARTGGQPIGVPGNSTFFNAGQPFDPALDIDGSAAIKVQVNPGQSNVYETFFVFDAPANTTRTIVQVNNSGTYAGALDLRGGILGLTIQGAVGGAELYQATGVPGNQVGLGGPEQVFGNITGLRVATDGSVSYRATAAAVPPATGTTTKHIIEFGSGVDRTQVRLADTGIAGNYVLLYNPAGNDSRQLASKVWWRSGGLGIDRFDQAQPPLTLFALAGSAFDTLNDFIGMNNAGDVAFTVRRSDTFQWEVRKTVGGVAGSDVRVAGAGTTNFTNLGWSLNSPRINSRGWVAFRGEQNPGASGGQGVFVGDGTGAIVRVAGDGTVLPLPSGGTATMGIGASPNRSALAGNIAFNDASQVAFLARLSDGTTALVIATPLIACNPADIANTDGGPGPDGQVDNGDFQRFFAFFFAGCTAGAPTPCNPADIARADAAPGPDGAVNNGDFQLFFSSFFSPCQ